MKNIVSLFLVTSLIFSACHNDFLDIKQDQRVAVPTTLRDMQSMLDYVNAMNWYGMQFLGEIGSDDYYLTEANWNLLVEPYQKNGYIWASDIYNDQQCVGWNKTYQKVLYANMVLEGLDKLNRGDAGATQWDALMGTALFYRAWSFYQLAQVFCSDYSESSQALGIPLRLTSDINVKVSRATVAETYGQILADIQQAVDLLPLAPAVVTRPGKAVALAVLSKTYLQMGQYENAMEAAKSYLNVTDELLDYNELDSKAKNPFPMYGMGNPETPFFEIMNSTLIFAVDRIRVDTTLYKSYDDKDLRKSIYFYELNNDVLFGGSYSGYETLSGAPATDEVYLIYAECAARLNLIQEALERLNLLLIHRYERGAFIPLTIAGQGELLNRIVDERRKELLFRGVRWSDLRRFSREPAFAKKLERKVGEVSYELLPGSNRYVWPIPENAVALGGYEQNIR